MTAYSTLLGLFDLTTARYADMWKNSDETNLIWLSTILWDEESNTDD